jgi:hypothetical protein
MRRSLSSLLARDDVDLSAPVRELERSHGKSGDARRGRQAAQIVDERIVVATSGERERTLIIQTDL